MAITDAYATVEEYMTAGGSPMLSTENNAAITRDLLAVSRFLDRQLGWEAGFQKDSTGVERTYVARGCRVDVANFVSISALEVDGVVTTDYVKLPRNAAVGPEPQPYRQVEGSWGWGAELDITAIWGWPAVPSAIKTATIELTRIWRIESPRASSSIQEVNVFVGMSSVAKNLLAAIPDAYICPSVYV